MVHTKLSEDLMLCSPHTQDASLPWEKVDSSPFLTLEVCEGMYNVKLAHNSAVVGVAESKQEADRLWSYCTNISRVVKSEHYLTATFEGLFQESKQDNIKFPDPRKTQQKERTLSIQEQHVVIQLAQLLKQHQDRFSVGKEQSMSLVQANEDATVRTEQFLTFQKGDLLATIPHPDDDSLLYAQSLTKFGAIEKKSVSILKSMEEEDLMLSAGDTNSQPSFTQAMKEHQKIGSLRGWLKKRGYWMNQDYKKRWFKLDLSSARLYYYLSPEEEKKHNYQGFIDLKEVTTVHESFVPDTTKQTSGFTFEIHTLQRLWVLLAHRQQEMEMWVFHLNQVALLRNKKKGDFEHLAAQRSKVLQRKISYAPTTTTPGNSDTGSMRKSSSSNSLNSSTGSMRRFPEYSDVSLIAADDFSQFGSPNGEEIENKATILEDIDRFLGYKSPPDVEYVFVEPYLNYASENVYLTANPYGHAVVRYTLPDTKEQLVMNIVGLANHEMVNFLHPEDFFFSTNFDTKLGNEQGGIYNRNFSSIRIQRVPPEKIIAMHQYYLDLRTRSKTNWANYNILLGPLLNRTGIVSYGNCAHWSSQGLRQAGVLKKTSMFPKSIWCRLFEELCRDCQQEKLSNNISIVYYKRIPHAQKFYGGDTDWTGWGRPTDYFKTKYDDMESLADAIVMVPEGSKKAVIQIGPRSALASLENRVKYLKQEGRLLTELRFDIHVEPRILFNEIFYDRFHASSLQKVDVHIELENVCERPYKLVACGLPLLSNSWMVDKNDLLFCTYTNTGTLEDLQWKEVERPVLEGKESENLHFSFLAAGEDETCWVIYDEQIFYQKKSVDTPPTWKSLPKPSSHSIIHLAIVTMEEGLWVLDALNCLYYWHFENEKQNSEQTDASGWKMLVGAPALTIISVGLHQELWGITKDNIVYRRVLSEQYPEGKWIPLHGALLKQISIVSANEVWGVDWDGKAYILSSDFVPVTEISTEEEEEKSPLDELHDEEEEQSHLCWQELGNILPIASIQATSQTRPWAISHQDPSFFYRISKHRLLVLSTKSSKKVWDDRGSGCKPFHVGFWCPQPPKDFFALGDIAERSHLENSSTEALVVCEVGLSEGEDPILCAPLSFELVWKFKGGKSHYASCFIWKGVAPPGYVALGNVVTITNSPPSLDRIRCVHSKYLNESEPCSLSRASKYLWANQSVRKGDPVSVWLVKPRLDSLWCNIFLTSNGTEPPTSGAVCLKLSASQ